MILKPNRPIINWHNPITNKLILDVPFFEKGGTITHDIATIFNGTWKGTLGSQWINSGFGISGNFNGTDNYISFNLWSTTTQSWSMGGWFKSNDYTRTEQCLISNGDGSGNGYALILSGNGGIAGQVYLLNNNIAWGANLFNVQDNNWHHIIFTVSADGNTNKCYLDGILKFTGGNSSLGTPGTGSYIGANSATTNQRFFKGLLDGMRFWKRELGLTEIQELYANSWQIYKMPQVFKGLNN